MFVANVDALAQLSKFRLKRDRLSSSAKCRIRSWEVWDTKSSANWMPTHKAVELLRIKQKTVSAHSYDEWAFSPIDFTANWIMHLFLATYVCCFNFESLAQASNFRIEKRPVVFLCWMQDSKLRCLRHQIASSLVTHSQTNWAIKQESRKKLEHNIPFEGECPAWMRGHRIRGCKPGFYAVFIVCSVLFQLDNGTVHKNLLIPRHLFELFINTYLYEIKVGVRHFDLAF